MNATEQKLVKRQSKFHYKKAVQQILVQTQFKLGDVRVFERIL